MPGDVISVSLMFDFFAVARFKGSRELKFIVKYKSRSME